MNQELDIRIQGHQRTDWDTCRWTEFVLLSPFLQTRADQLAKVYQPLRSVLISKSRISVAHLLAARQDFSKILRTSSGKMREKTACAINKVNETVHQIYGQV